MKFEARESDGAIGFEKVLELIRVGAFGNEIKVTFTLDSASQLHYKLRGETAPWFRTGSFFKLVAIRARVDGKINKNEEDRHG